MSFSTWHNYGYGICVSELNFNSVKRLRKLLHKAPKYKAEIIKWMKECKIVKPNIEDYEEFDQDYCFGIATILCGVINEAENISLYVCDDFENNIYLLYGPEYPWHIPKNEYGITMNHMNYIFKTYLSVVTDDEIEVDYQEAANGG